MDSFPHLYPLTSLQIGNIKSYLSRAFLFFAPISNKFLILVDNQSWRVLNKISRSAQIKELMSTKYRMSPFKNSRTLLRSPSLRSRSSSSSSSTCGKSSHRWLPTVSMATLRENSPFSVVKLYKNLHGFIVFEVAWEDVGGINYLNPLQKDASLALEVKSMRKWEFYGIDQALRSICSWFSGTQSETLTLQNNLFLLQQKVIPSRSPNQITISSRELLFDDASQADQFSSEDIFFDVRQCFLDSIDHDNNKLTVNQTAEYQHTFLLFSFNDMNLPSQLKQIITSDFKLLALLEAGLPSWVIFLQSYPLFCKIYRHWMPPLLRTIYIFISLVTVITGLYDLYKNVPLLKATASHLCGPLFEWFEAWDMISRIRYLGTFLFLQNLEKAVKWFVMMARVVKLPVLLLTRPLMQPLEEMIGVVISVWSIFAGTGEQFYITAWTLVEPFCSMVSELFEILLSPFGLLCTYIWSSVTLICACFRCIWEMLLTSTQGSLMFSNYVASTCNAIFAMLQRVLFTSSMKQIRYVSPVKSASSGVSYWNSLQNDLYSEVFKSLRNIVRGLVAFSTSCNQHRLSIYNRIREIVHHPLRLAPHSFSSQQASDQVESNLKVDLKKCDCCHHR